jgi:hypothetical protein
MHEKEVETRAALELIKQDHEWRQRHPDLFFAELADDLWRTMPDDEAIEDFKLRLANVPWWATDVVECLEGILRNRPDWAARTLVEASRRGPWLGGSPDDTPEVYIDWLATQTRQMRQALDTAND